MNMRPLSIGVVGAGYFAQLHHQAWHRCRHAELVAIADRNPDVTVPAEIPLYRSLDEMLASQMIDLLDIVVPPDSHCAIIETAIAAGIPHIICQKPFCQSLEQAEYITATAEAAGISLVIHENFRFQPWYRLLKSNIDDGAFGQIYQFRFALRPGDGRGADAYLARQPYFQQMPRFLVHETAVHFLDLFCFLFGKPRQLYADLRQLNPVLKGEDAGVIMVEFDNQIRAIFDGNRLADHLADNPRLTMGEAWLETEAGVIMLTGSGQLGLRHHGQQQEEVLLPAYEDSQSFGGDCVFHLCQHVADAWAGGRQAENTAREYLEIMKLVTVAYQSAAEGRKINLEM
jgi:predicted dehydrogenase